MENSKSNGKVHGEDGPSTAALYLLEITKLRDMNNALNAEMSKIVRVGRREEIDFAEEVRSWPGIWASEKLKKYGDYILAYRDPGGSPAEPRMVVDNKDKDTITETDIEKLIRDAKEQSTPVATSLRLGLARSGWFVG
jgi:hypothetical protein